MTNWVETLGHGKGYLQFRWQRVSRALTEADGPTMEIAISAKSRESCPTTSRTKSPKTTGRERIALRQKLIGNRMVG